MLLYRCYMKKIITSFFIIFTFFIGSSQAAIVPNDPFFSNQWYLSKIRADSAWEKITESPHTVIAVIDSGIQIDHPDLKNNIWINTKEVAGDGLDNDNNGFIDDIFGWDFVNNVPDPSPKFTDGWTEAGVSHGTMVAGIIAAHGNNNIGVTGVTWRAKIMALKALNDKGEGRVSDVIRAIDYAINNGADIINLSFSSLNYSEGLQEAIYRAHAAGIMIVAAAGNEQASGSGYSTDTTKIYPACYDGRLIGENMVIGVAATDALDQKTRFSSYGFSCIDIAAPGISFFNTVTNGNVPGADKYYDGYWSGTSMAAPLVSATLALIQQTNPELSRRETVNILFASADNISRLNPEYLGQLGNGRLNTNRAVEMAKNALNSRLGYIFVAPQSVGQEPKIVTANGNLVTSWLDSDFSPGSSFATGDVDGDGLEEVVIGAAIGEPPKVVIFDKNGNKKFDFFTHEPSFLGGINVAVFDLNNDGRQEIIIAPASAGPAEIKIFDYQGSLKNSFFIADRNWRGGLSIAAGDLDGKGKAQIVAGFGPGHEPQIRLINSEGRVIGVFLAYEKSFRGGVNVAVANLDGRIDRSKAEIIVAPGPGRAPQIKIFDHRAKLKNSFLGYDSSWQAGVSISAGDIDNDGVAEIILSAYPGGAPHIRIFNLAGNILESFYTFVENFTGGIKAGIIMIKN